MKHSKPDVNRLIEFHKFLNTFAEIERVIHIKRKGRVQLENDTEHSYNLAMMAWFLTEYFPELDASKVVLRALVHDLVEIHAGDTFVFAEQEHLDSKAAREAAAQKQLAQDWSDFPALHAAIADYESLGSPEARFVYALDKLIPMFTEYLNGGITWTKKHMSLQRLNLEKPAKMKVYPALLPYWEELYAMLINQPELFPADMLK